MLISSHTDNTIIRSPFTFICRAISPSIIKHIIVCVATVVDIQFDRIPLRTYDRRDHSRSRIGYLWCDKIVVSFYSIHLFVKASIVSYSKQFTQILLFFFLSQMRVFKNKGKIYIRRNHKRIMWTQINRFYRLQEAYACLCVLFFSCHVENVDVRDAVSTLPISSSTLKWNMHHRFIFEHLIEIQRASGATLAIKYIKNMKHASSCISEDYVVKKRIARLIEHERIFGTIIPFLNCTPFCFAVVPIELID